MLDDPLAYAGPGRLVVLPPGVSGEELRKDGSYVNSPYRKWQNKALQTHCLRGHAYTPENTRISKRGTRSCKECERRRKRKKA